MPKVILHLGLAKTGTKAIQTAIKARQARFNAAGIHVLRTGRFGPAGGHHCLAWTVQDDAHANWRCRAYEIAQTKQEIMGVSGQDILLSSEEFSPLAYMASARSLLISLFDAYEKIGLVYVREQTEFFNSFFVELVKDLQCTESIGETVAKLRDEPRYDYANWLGPWRQSLDDLVVRPFSREMLTDHDVVVDFLSTLRCITQRNHRVSKEPMVVNESLSALQVAALQHAARELRSKGIDPSACPARWMSAKRNVHEAIDHPDMARGGKYWGIGPALAQDLREQYEEKNAVFFADFMGKPYSFPRPPRPRSLNRRKLRDVPESIRDRLTAVLAAA